VEKAFRLLTGDSLKLLKTLPANSVDSCVCDPPYHLTTGKKGGSGAASLNLNSPAGRARIGTGGFMGMKWDGGDIAFRMELWSEVLRVLKPGAHLLAFGGTRTYHRMVCAIEDAGFEIRDQIGWLYGSGFPKSLDVSKAIDKAAGAKRKREPKPGGSTATSVAFAQDAWTKAHGATRLSDSPITENAAQWNGWGTALKPAWEPIVLARKPLIGTVAQNVQRFGTGAINIDASRVGWDKASLAKDAGRRTAGMQDIRGGKFNARSGKRLEMNPASPSGRWPANIIHDGSDEVLSEFAKFVRKGASAPVNGTEESTTGQNGIYGHFNRVAGAFHGDTGTAARFFYCAKASKRDRDEGVAGVAGVYDGRRDGSLGKMTQMRKNNHPTVKPTALMRYLCKLVTPPGGTVLDCFMGSGSTGKAAKLEGFSFVGMDLSKDYVRIAKARIAAVTRTRKRDRAAAPAKK
jgi:site-specific DNA-methyltransferase (adenine-specific)